MYWDTTTVFCGINADYSVHSKQPARVKTSVQRWSNVADVGPQLNRRLSGFLHSRKVRLDDQYRCPGRDSSTGRLYGARRVLLGPGFFFQVIVPQTRAAPALKSRSTRRIEIWVNAAFSFTVCYLWPRSQISRHLLMFVQHPHVLIFDYCVHI